MENFREMLDAVLYYIRVDPNLFYPIEPVLYELRIPTDLQHIQSIVECLLKDGYVEVKDNRYDYPEIKINEKGLEFINRTCYVESEDVGDMSLVYFMSTEVKTNKENLEIESLKLQIHNYRQTISDYPETRTIARQGHNYAMFNILISFVSLMLSEKGCH